MRFYFEIVNNHGHSVQRVMAKATQAENIEVELRAFKATVREGYSVHVRPVSSDTYPFLLKDFE